MIIINGVNNKQQKVKSGEKQWHMVNLKYKY